MASWTDDDVDDDQICGPWTLWGSNAGGLQFRME